MSRPAVMAASFHAQAYGHPLPHAHAHAPFASAAHSGLTYRQHPQTHPHPHTHHPLHSHPHPLQLQLQPQPQPQQAPPAPAPELPAGYNSQHTGHHACTRTRTSTVRMAGPAYMAADDELAHFQKLSNDYEPPATGPLVGERQSSSAIATEYEAADPVYRIKTAALPDTYAYFRTCRGDGHCGWRAIAFTYFETLLRIGDVNRLEDEEVRLSSMHNLLNLAGFSQHVYIDWVEEAFDLLRKLANSLRAMDGSGPDILLQTFNDMSTAMAIITYFKLLASAWIQSHPDDFAAFCHMDLKSYCQLNIEAAQCEIDNVAVVALAESVVKPAGIGLEIMYLDRSPGEEINNTYRAEPTDHTGLPLSHPPMMRLLYRPGHYDILYKAEDFPAPVQYSQPTQSSLHVALAGYTDDFVPTASNMSDVMTMIPGMYPTGLGQRWPSVSYDHYPSPAPQPQLAPVQTYAPTPTPAVSVAPIAPVTSSHQDYVSPIHASHGNHHSIHLEPPVTLPIHPPPSAPPMIMERTPSMAAERGGPFRPSVYELEPGFGSGPRHALPFQTSIFRNSHFNTAHFLNPDFQPEEWSPDSEYATGNRGRHKSTSQ